MESCFAEKWTETYLEITSAFFVEPNLSMGWLDRSRAGEGHSEASSIAPGCFGAIAEPFNYEGNDIGANTS